VKEQGYTGSSRTIYRYLETLKQAEVTTSAHPQRIQKYSPYAAIWLLVRDPKSLDELEQEDLAAFCQASIELKKAYDLVQDFFSMLHKREGYQLDAWLEKVAKSNLVSTPVLCLWCGTGQSRCTSGSNMVDQQRSGGRISDQG
jgi:transposase